MGSHIWYVISDKTYDDIAHYKLYLASRFDLEKQAMYPPIY